MDENLKQRIVGAAVLLALAIIFLPSLFYKEKRVEIDTVTQIPPSPKIEPVVIPQPSKPKGVDIPPSDQLFQPEFVETTEEQPLPAPEKTQAEIIKPVKKPIVKIKKVVEQPRLNALGTPIG